MKKYGERPLTEEELEWINVCSNMTIDSNYWSRPIELRKDMKALLFHIEYLKQKNTPTE